MKHVQLAILSTLALLTMTSCGLLTDDASSPRLVDVPVYRITGVDVRPLSDGDTLRAMLRFRVTTETEVIEIRQEEERPCDDVLLDCLPQMEVVNPTDPDTRFMRFNSDIHYYGRRIEAGINLLADEEIVHAFDGSQLDLRFPFVIGPDLLGTVAMKEGAFELQEGWYEIDFGWGTADGEIFSDRVRVYIAL